MLGKLYYAGTFDPITMGHVDIIHRAQRLAQSVVVAVAPTERKNTLYSLAQRLQMATDTFASEPSVEVCVCAGLAVEGAMSHGADGLLRGLRSTADVESELAMSRMNEVLSDHQMPTIFLCSSAQNAHISSTIIRELIQLGHDPKDMLPGAVRRLIKTWRDQDGA